MGKLTPDLVERALAGDRAAVQTLVDQLTPVIQMQVGLALQWRCRAQGRDARQEVEDLVQEVFVELFRNDGRVLRTWDPQKGAELPTFVAVIAHRQVATILRTKSQSPWTESPTPDDELADGQERSSGEAPSPERLAASRELLQAILDGLLSRLTDRGRELFQLDFIEERPTEEIAALMGMGVNAIYAWRNRFDKMVTEIHGALMQEARPRPRKTN